MKLVSALFGAIAVLLSAVSWAGPVDINTADAATLQQLNGIGPAKAAAILEYRKKNGSFRSVDELAKVDGIGEKTVEGLRAQAVVGAKPAAAAKPAVKK